MLGSLLQTSPIKLALFLQQRPEVETLSPPKIAPKIAPKIRSLSPNTLSLLRMSRFTHSFYSFKCVSFYCSVSRFALCIGCRV